MTLGTAVLRVGRDLGASRGEPEDPPDVPAPRGPEDDREERVAAVSECIERLPSKRRLFAHLAWIEGVRSADIADRLGMKRPAVSMAKKKALPALEECLRDKGYDERSLAEGT